MRNDIGEGIRKRREQLGLSMRTVASAAGISPSMLSQVETGKLNPSVTTLYGIASYLEVSVDALLGLNPRSDDESETELMQKAVQRTQDDPTIEFVDGVTWQRLASHDPDSTEATLVTYEPGAASSPEGKLTRHLGIEFGYVLQGELTFQLGYERTVLRTGDSFSFSAEVPHVFGNHTTETSIGLWVVSENFREEDHGATSRFNETRFNVMNALRNSI